MRSPRQRRPQSRCCRLSRARVPRLGRAGAGSRGPGRLQAPARKNELELGPRRVYLHPHVAPRRQAEQRPGTRKLCKPAEPWGQPRSRPRHPSPSLRLLSHKDARVPAGRRAPKLPEETGEGGDGEGRAPRALLTR